MTLAPFIHLACHTLDPCTASDALEPFATRHWMCSSCNTQLPGVAPIDVCIQETSIRHKFMSGVDFLGLVHDDFLALFDESLIRRDLKLGRVFTENGRQLVGWHTLRARRCVIVRGSLRGGYRVSRGKMVYDQNVPGYRVCEECGRNIYYDEGKKYLFPWPPDDADLFETPNIGLVVRAHLLEHVDLSKFRKLSIEHLPVLDQPLDGLGVLNCV